MGKNGFIEGLWNGFKVEFGKVYSNLNAFAFNPIHEAEMPTGKKLRVFDFDDTLVQTNSTYTSHIKTERNQN